MDEIQKLKIKTEVERSKAEATKAELGKNQERKWYYYGYEAGINKALELFGHEIK